MRLGAILLGAGLMYFFDPSNGIRRRQWLRDQWVSYRPVFSSIREMVRPTDSNEAEIPSGLLYPDTTTLDSDWDYALQSRVEEAVSERVSAPGSVTVSIKDGVVTLKGNALLSEIALVMERVGTLPGVTQVENRVKVRQPTDSLSEAEAVAADITP